MTKRTSIAHGAPRGIAKSGRRRKETEVEDIPLRIYGPIAWRAYDRDYFQKMGVSVGVWPDADIAAIVVHGGCALYSIAHEHRPRKTRVPNYLLQFAREHENALIPAMEALYVPYFCEAGVHPDGIPGPLREAIVTATNDPTLCARDALRLHRLLIAFQDEYIVSQRKVLEYFPSDRVRQLFKAMVAAHKAWQRGRPHR